MNNMTTKSAGSGAALIRIEKTIHGNCMSHIKLKQAHIEGSLEQFEYSGEPEVGFTIILKDNDFINLMPELIAEIMSIMGKYNPLLNDAPDPIQGSSRVRFEHWIENESLRYFGRQLTAHDALLIRSVFGAEGVLPFGYGIFGRFKVGEFPHADPVTALNECVGRICIYREKGVFLRVKLACVSVREDSVFIELQPIESKGFHLDSEHFEAGSSFNNLMILDGHITNFMPGWTLITANAFVEHLTDFAVTLPTRQAFIKEISETLNPNFGAQMPFRPNRLP